MGSSNEWTVQYMQPVYIVKLIWTTNLFHIFRGGTVGNNFKQHKHSDILKFFNFQN